MKRLILAAVLVLSAASCVAKMPATYTPQTKTLYVLTDVVNSLGILQVAAENAVPNNVLSLATATRIVQFCVASNSTIVQYPNGWYATINTAYIKLKLSMTPNELSKFSSELAVFEVVLNSFNGLK